MLSDLPALNHLARSTDPRARADYAALLDRSIRQAEARRARIPRIDYDPALPIAARRDEIAQAIATNQIVVLCGETGSGKTTQLPKICLDAGRGVRGMIGHTQPRRLAARSVAARIAHELGTRLGDLVGFKVRFNDTTDAATAVKLMTDGILLAEATSPGGDADLLRYDTLIIDEAHERSLNIDFLLGYLKRLTHRRPDLKVIVTSATIDPARFSAFFGGAPVINVSGRTFPVEVRYRPVADDEESLDQIETDAILDAADELCSPRGCDGDILVFLPGEREIRQAADSLARDARLARELEILPLYARLSEREQDRVFSPAPGGKRRIVLATNVAETSLTVPGIRSVIDTGLVRIARYDARKKVDRLPIEMVSQASANQRSGRCGRVAAGIAIRLYSEKTLAARPVFTDPEIRRTDLAGVILRCKAMSLGPITEFPFIDPPDAHAVKDGIETLFELGALESPAADAPLTDIGRRLAAFPAEPRVARVLISAAELGVLEPALTLAAALCIQDPLTRPIGREQAADAAHGAFRSERSDFITLLNLWHQHEQETGRDARSSMAWCRDHFVSAARMREWSETRSQFADIAEDAGLANAVSEPADEAAFQQAIHTALLSGLITNALCRDDAGSSFEYLGIRGNRASIFPGSSLFKKRPKWLLAAEIVQTSRLYARTIGPIEPEWIERAAPHMLTRVVSDPHLDPNSGEPSCFEKVTLSGLTISPRRRALLADADRAASRAMLIDKLLVENQHPPGPSFVQANAAALARAASLAAKLRRASGVIDVARLRAWFDERVPADIATRAALNAWLAQAEKDAPTILHAPLAEMLAADARDLDPAAFPDDLTLAPGESPCRLRYELVPGQPADGVTLVLPLLKLDRLDDRRADWLIPGLLAEKAGALIKQLPKADRERIEQAHASRDARIIGRELAAVIAFGEGALADALSEAADVLLSVKIDRAAWSLTRVPDHLRLRVEVIDDHGKVIADGRDVAELRTRLAGRLAKAQAGAAKKRFARTGITSWDFDALPASVPIDDSGSAAFPSLIDELSAVSLTLLPTQKDADVANRFGIRRLFVLAAIEELDHRIDALPNASELFKHFGPPASLGTPDDLRDALRCLIAERVFMQSQPPIRDRAAFEDRLTQQWGRLGQTAIDTGDLVARILEPRHRIAARLASGVRRQWAASVADIREHAAYLMPADFLRTLPIERLARFPAYALAMRERLLNLREDGSTAEAEPLRLIAAPWKRFTGWVAAAMNAQRAAQQADAAASDAKTEPSAKPRGPLPPARRAAVTVNTDAGWWAMQPGNLSPAAENYRWLVEDLRVALFTNKQPEAAALIKRADDAWRAVESRG